MMVFVTGSTGLLGSHLLGYLAGMKGEKVCALKRHNSRMEDVREVFRLYTADEARWEAVQWVEGDVLVPETLEESVAAADCVFHCAAVVSFAGGDKSALLDINLKGSENIARLCLKHRVRLCYVSSIAALGDASFEKEIIDEETPVIEGTPHSVYSQSKMAAEKIVWQTIAEGLEAVIVNPSIILGAGHWGRSSSRLYMTVSRGIPFYTQGICGYVDVRDVCEVMVRLAADRTIRGERFVVNGGNYSYKQLFTAIAGITGHRPPFIRMRPWMTEIAWRILAIVGKLKGQLPAFTRETARSSQHKSCYSAAKLHRRFPDFTFRSLDETVRSIHAAYRRKQTEPDDIFY
ncbi:MAG: NAD-dependent epimerase/dehydratase family protein [Oscillibacter sp.]|nr:NAD-dependent epimerase/dehydratase family protein [Oscillibacter sp.]